MKKSTILMVLLCLPFLVGASAKSTWTYRYRLTLNVETPEGAKSGSSVIEVRATLASGLLKRFDPTGGNIGMWMTGEAVAVDLGERGVLFALLKGRGPNGEPGSEDAALTLPNVVFVRAGALNKSAAREETLERLEALHRQRQQRGEMLKEPEIPFLVRFGDINDPRSVEAVDPKQLNARFGPGVRLASAWIEMTNDPVTTEIEKRLGWLTAGYPEKRLVAATGKPIQEVPPEHLLVHGNFSKGSR